MPNSESPGKAQSGPRCAAIVGSYGSGKTTLLESLLHAAGAIPRRGSVKDGATVGDASAEARSHGMSTELNFAHCSFLGETWHLIDAPGSVELLELSYQALLVADVVVVVTEPNLDRLAILAPLFKFMDSHNIPHVVYVNKMDKSDLRARDLMAGLQEVSEKPLVLRQVPIRDGEAVTGFVDLVSERAYAYREGQPSDLIEMPDEMRDREGEARQELLESLADFDDDLLEQLLEDKVPATQEVYQQLAADLRQDLIVPVFLGSAERENGVTRLWKALRHEAPEASTTAKRLSLEGKGSYLASVLATQHHPHTGKLSMARVWRGPLAEGANVVGERLSGLYRVMGGETEKLARAESGDLVALGRRDNLATGALFDEANITYPDVLKPESPEPVYAVAVEPENRQDEVKLTAGLAKLAEEDPSISSIMREDTGQLLLRGQGEVHLKLAVERLKNKFNVAVRTDRPQTGYKETIRRSADHHSRYKRQSGGHGQFADIKIRIKPRERGSGFQFSDSVVGGSVPRNYIPAVESGVRESLVRGPLGFQVVDLEVELYDGQHHSVDSSDQAFKICGRQAITDALVECDPVLLEPIHLVTISVPQSFTNRIHGLISSRRGQILGFDGKAGWTGWDDHQAYMPESELQDLIIELRSLTQGTAYFTAVFDHLQELQGRLADQVVQARQAAQ
ncbi:elongation factor G [Limibacillus sp. MBR-115]|jgi:elongation factor G|uniref:elongation factor G n=1 Tax=Limibacillus sp. MBR-115 TaxID=3156465 RepID=UPI003394F62F